MLVIKTTYGFVEQVYDTETGKFTRQSFEAGTQVEYENSAGFYVDPEKLEDSDGKVCQLPFDMVQPNSGTE